MHIRRRPSGFTLLELIVTLTVMMIAVGFAIPNFNRMVAGSRVNAAANDLLTIFHAARSQSMRTRQRAVVCPSSNGESCDGTNWGQAIMFLDTDKNGSLGGSEQVLRRVQINTSQVKITNLADSVPLIFLPDGTARMGDTSAFGIADPSVAGLCSDGAPGHVRLVNVGFSSAQTEVLKSTDSAAAGCAP